MADKTTFRVVREHQGDRFYREGDERTANPGAVRHLVPHVLAPMVDAPAVKASEAAPKNKAKGAAPKNKAEAPAPDDKAPADEAVNEEGAAASAPGADAPQTGD